MSEINWATELGTSADGGRRQEQERRRDAQPEGWVTIDEAEAAFETEVDSLIQLAQSELRLTRLAAELQRTSRRVNALEQILIPRLEAERDFIQMALDERERTDHFRLKRIKQSRQHKAKGGT